MEAIIKSEVQFYVLCYGKFNHMKQDVNRLIPFELENENDVDDDVVRARRNAAANADAFRQALI